MLSKEKRQEIDFFERIGGKDLDYYEKVDDLINADYEEWLDSVEHNFFTGKE